MEHHNRSCMKTLMICMEDVKDESVRQLYYDAIEDYNLKVDDLMNAGVHDMCLDSGFDLYAPYTIMFDGSGISRQVVLNHEIQARVVDDAGVSYPYYLYPRSSLSKSNLRLANSVGIIDSGYRGSIIAKFDVHDIHTYDHPNMIQLGQRYTQICANDLIPFRRIINVTREELGHTSRGSGGFGSTGQ